MRRAVHAEHGVPKHVLENMAHFQDGIPGGGLAQGKEVSGQYSQLEQGDGQLGVCGDRLLHGGVLLLQVSGELLQEFQESGPDHLE